MAVKSLSEILNGETRFGRLTVLGEGEKQGKYRRALCRCDCGEERLVHTFSLTGGRTVSCGCYHHEKQVGVAAGIGRRNRRHGMWGTPEYGAWKAMLDRCRNPRNHAYENYGGRGITVCKRWQVFDNFLADMGIKPSPDLSLDRIDNDRGYAPENCRWATASEQNQNRRPFEIGKPKA